AGGGVAAPLGESVCEVCEYGGCGGGDGLGVAADAGEVFEHACSGDTVREVSPDPACHAAAGYLQVIVCLACPLAEFVRGGAVLRDGGEPVPVVLACDAFERFGLRAVVGERRGHFDDAGGGGLVVDLTEYRLVAGGDEAPVPIAFRGAVLPAPARSAEHTSELQSRFDIVCR